MALPDPSTQVQADQDATAGLVQTQASTSRTQWVWSPGGFPASVTTTPATPGGDRAWTTGSLHEPTSVNGRPVTSDDAGNISSTAVYQLTHDGLHRLVRISDGTGGTTMTYDALGRLTAVVDASGGTTRYTWLGDQLMQLSSAAGDPVVQYALPLAGARPFLATTAAGDWWLAHDHTSSLALAVDTTGTPIDLFLYDDFGSGRILDPATLTPQASQSRLTPSFQGQPLLGSTGIYQWRARNYDPKLFAFLEPDPRDHSSSWCPYLPLGGNPLAFQDPTGEYVTILVGAVVGAMIGGVGAWMSGGDARDILVGIGAGAVGGAIAGAGNPVLGAAVAGGIMGAWSGGRIGYQKGGTEGAIGGGAIGGVAGAGIGALGGTASGYIGNLAATGVSGAIYSALPEAMSATTANTLARGGGVIAGGYVGGASGATVSNLASVTAVDLATGRPITTSQLWDAERSVLTVDGPLAAVGAQTERSLFVRGLQNEYPGIAAGAVGAEGERLVGRSIGIPPAEQSQRLRINGRTRYPDFDTARTLADLDAVVEVKNKDRLSAKDIAQIRDFADFAAANNARLTIYERPGAGLSQTAIGRTNIDWPPIPQQPLVVMVPTIPPPK